MKVLMTPQELKSYQDQLLKRSVEKALAEAVRGLAAAAPVRKSVLDPEEAYSGAHREDAGELADFQKSFSIAKFIRGKLYERMGVNNPWRSSEFEKSISKAMAEGTGSSGGFLVPEQYMMTLIPLLMAKSVVRAAGATVYTVTRNELSLPKQTGAAGTTWGYENEDMSEDTNATFAQVTLQLRKLRALLYVSNELIDDADPAVDQLITVDLVRQISLAEDLAFLEGVGGAQPLGLSLHPNVATATLGSGNGATPTLDNFLNAMYAIDLNNGSYTAWVMHPRTLNTIRQIKDAQGNAIYWKDPLGRLPEQLFGLPIYKTTQVTVTNTKGTSGAVCSYVILANWPEVAIGQKNELRLEASREGGNAWESDQTSFRAVRRVDMVPRQPNEIYVMKGVKS